MTKKPKIKPRRPAPARPPAQPKTQWGGPRVSGDEALRKASGANRPRGGYRGAVGADGLTGRQRLDIVKAQRELLKLRVERGELIEAADVDAQDQADAEIISSDLLSLPDATTGRLVFPVLTPTAMREAMQSAIAEMVDRWQASREQRRATTEKQP